MFPCLDVYVRVLSDDRSAVLSRFIDQYVDTGDPGDPRFDAFVRTFVSCEPASGDLAALTELRRDGSDRTAFSLYLRARRHEDAIITITEEDELVLCLCVYYPDDDPEILHQASALMASLAEEFGATSGALGVEIGPPQSISEWAMHDSYALSRYERG